MNSLTIIGNLTRDPELRQVQSREGTVSVCDFTVAVNRRKKNEQGQDEADFFRCTVWRQQADNAAKYLAKGRKVAVRGSVSVRQYTGNDGVVRSSLEVDAQDVEYLTPNPNGQQAQGYAQTPAGYQPQAPGYPAPAYPQAQGYAPAAPGYGYPQAAPPMPAQPPQPQYQQQQMPIAGAPASAVPQGFTAVETDDLPF